MPCPYIKKGGSRRRGRGRGRRRRKTRRARSRRRRPSSGRGYRSVRRRRRRGRRSHRGGSGYPRNLGILTPVANFYRGAVNRATGLSYAWNGEPGNPSPSPTSQHPQPWHAVHVPALPNIPEISAAAGMAVHNM